jgi:hypothetical protein
MAPSDHSRPRPGGQALAPVREAWRVVLVAAAALTAFVVGSSSIPAARRGFGSAVTQPPLYGAYLPDVAGPAWVAIACGVVVTAAVATVWAKLSDRAAVAGSFVVMAAMSAAVAWETGDATRTFSSWNRPAEQAEATRVGRLGLRRYVTQYGSGHLPRSLSNHPPGRVVLRAALQHLFGRGFIAPSVVMCVLGSLVVVPTWALAKELIGPERARIAVLLLAVAPAPLVFTWASSEAIEATLLMAAAALLARGLMGDRPRWRPAVAGGVVLIASTFWTYSGAFLGVGCAIIVLARCGRSGWRRLALAGAGALIGLAVLRVALGYDILQVLARTRDAPHARIEARMAHDNMRTWWYWIVGGPAAWLVGAGAVIVAFGTRALRRIPPTRALLAVLGPLLVFHSLPAELTSLIPGELERTWLWMYPLAAIVAAVGLTTVVGDVRHRTSMWVRVMPALTAISLATAFVIEACWSSNS